MPPTPADLRYRILQARAQAAEAEEMARAAEQRGDGGRVAGLRATAARARRVAEEAEQALAAAGAGEKGS